MNIIEKVFELIGYPIAYPHPKEAVNPQQTNDTATVTKIYNSWLSSYAVPEANYSFWLNAISMFVYDKWTAEIEYNYMSGVQFPDKVPAFTLELNGKRLLYIQSRWLSPGVIAHEQAHNSKALLSDSDFILFINKFNKLSKEPYIRLLLKREDFSKWEQSVYWTEVHAELYRFIGEKMPDALKRFYPKLF